MWPRLESVSFDTESMGKRLDLEKSNQGGLLEKMLKALLISTKAWYSDRCLMTWKKKVSKANVLLFQLQASVLGIKENEFGLSPTTYPTPVVSDHLHNQSESIENWQKRAAEKKKQGINLHFALRHHVQMYPTPTASDMEGGAAKDVQIENGHFFRENKKGERWGVKLRDAIEMYPTPRASAAMNENLETVKKRVERRGKLGAKLEETIAMEMFPTPMARDHKDINFNTTWKLGNKSQNTMARQVLKDNKPGGKLNPNFVEFLMGFPMNWTKIDPTE